MPSFGISVARDVPLTSPRRLVRGGRVGVRGFTILELIVAVVVISVLALIAVLTFNTVIDESRWRTLETSAENFDRAFESRAAFGMTEEAAVADVTGEYPELPETIYDEVASTVEFVQFDRSVCLVLSTSV